MKDFIPSPTRLLLCKNCNHRFFIHEKKIIYICPRCKSTRVVDDNILKK